MESFQDDLRRRVERLEKRGAVHKDFVRKMCELEDELDLACLEEENGAPDGNKRRRRSTTLDVDDIMCTPVEEAGKDLQEILGGEAPDVFVENSTLNVKGKTFSKGDKVRITINKGEVVGTILSVGEGDVVLRTKDHRRLKVLLEDMRSTRSSIAATDEDSA